MLLIFLLFCGLVWLVFELPNEPSNRTAFLKDAKNHRDTYRNKLWKAKNKAKELEPLIEMFPEYTEDLNRLRKEVLLAERELEKENRIFEAKEKAYDASQQGKPVDWLDKLRQYNENK